MAYIRRWLYAIVFLFAPLNLLAGQPGDQSFAPPKTWVDPATGHRVVRLTDEPGSESLYFHQNAYTPDGKKMVYTTREGISVLDLDDHSSRAVVKGEVHIVVVGRKTGSIYYTRDGKAYAVGVDSGAVREIGDLPARASIATVNADETLLAGTYVETSSPAPATGWGRPGQPQSKAEMMEQRLAAHLPMVLFTMDVYTGAIKTIHKSTDWLNHLQFSPTDPDLLMFCHEGPWHKVDRTWTVRSDGSQVTKVHPRTMEMEIAGHEFWSADGKTIWYDLQTPRGEVFWVAGNNIETGERTWYHLDRNEWSIHFNVSRDGKLFCGDGGDPSQVAHAPDGRWIYLFRPNLIENHGIADKNFVRGGTFHSERLVDMSKHQYSLEPNVSFTLDQKWVVFRSNMFGPTYVFAVEVEKSKL